MSSVATSLPKVSSETLREVEQFLYRQSEILDEKRWLEFVDLFTEDGVYWMPAEPEQTTGDGVPSIFHEERWDGFQRDMAVFFFELIDETVWGATARILTDLLTRLVATGAGSPDRDGHPDLPES